MNSISLIDLHCFVKLQKGHSVGSICAVVGGEGYLLPRGLGQKDGLSSTLVWETITGLSCQIHIDLSCDPKLLPAPLQTSNPLLNNKAGLPDQKSVFVRSGTFKFNSLNLDT